MNMRLKTAFVAVVASVRQIAGQKVFAPWTNRWRGIWSTGVPQYDVWEANYFSDGQWIQPVSLSANPIKYTIYGVQVVVEETVLLILEQVGGHFGTYYSTRPVDAGEED